MKALTDAGHDSKLDFFANAEATGLLEQNVRLCDVVSGHG